MKNLNTAVQRRIELRTVKTLFFDNLGIERGARALIFGYISSFSILLIFHLGNYLSIHPSIYPPTYLHIHLTYLCIYSCIYLSICVDLSACALSVYLSICLSICPSISLCTYPSIHRSIYVTSIQCISLFSQRKDSNSTTVMKILLDRSYL